MGPLWDNDDFLTMEYLLVPVCDFWKELCRLIGLSLDGGSRSPLSRQSPWLVSHSNLQFFNTLVRVGKLHICLVDNESHAN